MLRTGQGQDKFSRIGTNRNWAQRTQILDQKNHNELRGFSTVPRQDLSAGEDRGRRRTQAKWSEKNAAGAFSIRYSTPRISGAGYRVRWICLVRRFLCPRPVSTDSIVQRFREVVLPPDEIKGRPQNVRNALRIADVCIFGHENRRRSDGFACERPAVK